MANSNYFLLCLAFVSHFFNLKFFLDLLNAFSTYLWPNYFPFCIQSKNFSVAKLVFLIYDTHLFFGGSVGKIGNYWKITTLTNTFKSILANSLHFFFTAMKRWKFQNHCDHCSECSEYTKWKKLQF